MPTTTLPEHSGTFNRTRSARILSATMIKFAANLR